MNINRYYAAGITAFVIWGFIPFPLRALTDYASGQIFYFRLLFSMLILLAIGLVFRKQTSLMLWQEFRHSAAAAQKKFVLFMVLGALLLTANWLTFIYVVNHIDVQTGSFAYLLCPIVTAVLGFLLLKEKIRPNQWLAIGLSALSCSLIGTGSLHNLAYSFLVALTYAFFLITQRVLKDYDKMLLLTLQLLLAFALVGPFYAFFASETAKAPDAWFMLVIASLAGLFTVIPLFLNLYALKQLTSGTIGILMYINPVMNFALAFVYYGEQADNNTVIAYALIFISIIIYNLPGKQAKRPG